MPEAVEDRPGAHDLHVANRLAFEHGLTFQTGQHGSLRTVVGTVGRAQPAFEANARRNQTRAVGVAAAQGQIVDEVALPARDPYCDLAIGTARRTGETLAPIPNALIFTPKPRYTEADRSRTLHMPCRHSSVDDACPLLAAATVREGEVEGNGATM